MHYQIILSVLLIYGFLQINAKPLDDRELAEGLLKIAELTSHLAERLEKRLENCEAASEPSTTPDPTRPPITTPEPTRPTTTPEPTRPPTTPGNLQPLFRFGQDHNSIVSPLGDE